MSKIFTAFLLCFSVYIQGQVPATLRVELGVENQKIVVKDAQLITGLTYPKGAKNTLLDLLNEGFSTLDALMRADSTHWCTDGLCYSLDDFKEDYFVLTEGEGTTEDIIGNYYDNLIDWVPQELLGDFIFDVLQKNVLNGTPLTLTNNDFTEDDYDDLTFAFPIKAPINLDRLTLIWLDRDTLNDKQKGRILGTLDGQLFFQHQIEQRLSDYYAALNFQPTYLISPETIRILPTRINRFLVQTLDIEATNRMAYLLLPRQFYKPFFEVEKDSIRIATGGGDAIYPFNLRKYVGGPTDQLPILPTNTLAQYQTQLMQQGYTINLGEPPSNLLRGIPLEEQSLFVDVLVKQLEGDTSSTNVPTAVPEVANRPSTVREAALDESARATSNVGNPQQLTTFQRNFIGVGVDLNLNDETRAKLVYQRLMRNASRLSLELAYAFNEQGFDNGGLIISGNYFKDFLFFNAIKKRMSVSLTAGSQFTANRVLTGVPLKERRNGAKANVEIDWYRNQTNQLFQSYLQASQENIELSAETIDFAATDIFSLDWGNTFFVKTPFRLLTTRFQIDSKLTLGWATIEQQSESTFYKKGSLTARLNQQLVRGMALDFTGYAQFADEATPFFEQIGHQVATNRGFKQDAVIARNLWGATIEFWTPLPRFGDKLSPLNAYLFKHLRFSIFSDISRYGKLVSKEMSVTLWSPGAGLRLLMGVAQVNFDWAIRRTPADFLQNGHQFSLNLVLNSPFQ
ncbi:MAG: hypothetical protein AAF960_20990 [Bacteroidota bacterium]